MLGALTLRYSFHGSDVLVMYTIMLAAAPAIIYLFYRGHTGLTLVLSVVIWSLCQRFPSGTSLPWIVANSAFPVAAWQMLFTLGMAAGYHREKVTGWLTRSVGSAGLVMLGSGSLYYVLLRSEQILGDVRIPLGFLGDPTYSSLFAKVELAPLRVLAFLAIAMFAYTALSSLWAPINASLGWLIIPLGQNSLYVYIVHLFVVVGIYNGVATAVPAGAGCALPHRYQRHQYRGTVDRPRGGLVHGSLQVPLLRGPKVETAPLRRSRRSGALVSLPCGRKIAPLFFH